MGAVEGVRVSWSASTQKGTACRQCLQNSREVILLLRLKGHMTGCGGGCRGEQRSFTLGFMEERNNELISEVFGLAFTKSHEDHTRCLDIDRNSCLQRTTQ